MRYPYLNEVGRSSVPVDAFGGYNHNLRIGDGEFFDMKNLTSDYYPVLSPRKKRGVHAASDTVIGDVNGIIARESLFYVKGSEVVKLNDPSWHFDLGLSTDPSDCPKRLVSFGAYLIVFPDKNYINVLQPYDRGSMEAHTTTEIAGTIRTTTYELCDVNGNVMTADYTGSTEPTGTVSNGALWIDTSKDVHVLKTYSSYSVTWSVVPRTYVKISGTGAETEVKDGDFVVSRFSVGDAAEMKLTPYVNLGGRYKEPGEETYFDDPQLDALNGSHIIRTIGTGYFVTEGIIDASVSIENVVTVDRSVPDMDFVIESRNRLWGCKYSGNLAPLNEIYACKLGDFRNWNVFDGLSTDSYAASCGTDGEWTGAVSYLGYPIFFKEKVMHRVYGEYPANFQIQDTEIRGVERGSSGSLAIVDEVLYYKSVGGVCAFNGSLPTEISDSFGEIPYHNAVGGSVGSKYYLSMQDEKHGGWHLFTYDVKKGFWMKEDAVHASSFASFRGELYYIDAEDGKIRSALGSGTPDAEPVSWMAETGDIGLFTGARKYVASVTFRLMLAVGSSARVFIRYDTSSEWIMVCSARGQNLNTVSLPVRPRRCDHFRLRIEGSGDAKIYSIDKAIEIGSVFR